MDYSLEARILRIVKWYGFINKDKNHINKPICYYKELYRWFTVEPRAGQNIQPVKKKVMDKELRKLVKEGKLIELKAKFKGKEVWAFMYNDGN